MAANTARIPNTQQGTVAGLFRDEGQAERSIDELKQAGFSDSEVGMATSSDQRARTGSFWDKVASKFGKQEHTENASDLRDSLAVSGIPENQARYFDSMLASGGMLVTVHTGPNRVPQAVSILQRNGADIGNAAATWKPSAPLQGTGREHRIQLFGEILRVHKERVSRGEVRIRKEVITEEQNIEVPVTREELVVERVPVQNRETAAGRIDTEPREVRIPLTEERVRVEKKPVVNEEVRVGTREVQDTKRVNDKVRHEELRVDEEGDIEKGQTDRLKDKNRGAA